MKEHFFSSQHWIRAGWTAIFAVVSFFGGMITNHYRSPQRVIVSNFPAVQSQQPLIVTSTLSPDSLDAINHLSTELDKLQNGLVMFNRHFLQNRNQDTNQSKMLHKDIANVNSAIDKLTAVAQKPSVIPNKQSSPSNLQLPPFNLPKVVEGYYAVVMSGVTDIYCPQRDVGKNADLQFGFRVLHDDMLQSTTPLFVALNKIIDRQHLNQVYAQQFKINHDKNNYQVNLNLEPGEYEFNFGYYLRNQVNTQYPQFHSKSCRITVHA